MTLSPREQIIYHLIREAAEKGEPCPDNLTLAMAADLASISGPARALKKMEAQGLLTVQRGINWRIAIFPDGPATARPWIDQSKAQLTSGERRRNKLADIIAAGGTFDEACHKLKASERAVMQMWRKIVRDLGWQAC